MADTSNENVNTTQEAAPQLTIRGQYIKDFSFEAPHGPLKFDPKTPPKMEVNVDLAGQKVGESVYELEIKVAIKANGKEEPLFVTELSYAGLFQIANVEENRVQPMLFIDCAFILFPFARRVIADVTRDGGFPPLMMEPIDFHALYARRMQQMQAESDAKKAG